MVKVLPIHENFAFSQISEWYTVYRNRTSDADLEAALGRDLYRPIELGWQIP